MNVKYPKNAELIDGLYWSKRMICAYRGISLHQYNLALRRGATPRSILISGVHTEERRQFIDRSTPFMVGNREWTLPKVFYVCAKNSMGILEREGINYIKFRNLVMNTQRLLIMDKVRAIEYVMRSRYLPEIVSILSNMSDEDFKRIESEYRDYITSLRDVEPKYAYMKETPAEAFYHCVGFDPHACMYHFNDLQKKLADTKAELESTTQRLAGVSARLLECQQTIEHYQKQEVERYERERTSFITVDANEAES